MFKEIILNFQLINLTGFLALVLFLATLTPSLIGLFFAKLRSQKWSRFLLKYRRQIGVWAWFFGASHGTMVIFVRNLNLFEPATAVRYFQGIALITIFSLLAITSNNMSVKYMKKNWKRLHRLTYLTLFLLPWHIVDKSLNYFTASPSIFNYFGLFLLTIFTIFSLERFRVFVQKKLDQLPSDKPPSSKPPLN